MSMWLLRIFFMNLALCDEILVNSESSYNESSSLVTSATPFSNDTSNLTSNIPFSCGNVMSTCASHNVSSIYGTSSTSSNINTNRSSMLTQQKGFKTFTPTMGDLIQGNNSSNQTFLSFHEWRLAKKNQEVVQEQQRSKTQEHIEPLESEPLGDDMEIELSVFSTSDVTNRKQEIEPEGKIYNHKFNFASLDCAATIVKTNSEASGATSILTENKDKYLLNPCSAPNKFVIIELCQDILVEEIAIANFEFFSSTFSRVRFSISDLYPVAKNGWRVLGEFKGNNSRNLQKFPIQNPQIWARYLRIEILSHHDNEFYCPLSLVRVHGKTMMDEFKMESIQELPSDRKNVRQVEESDTDTSKQCINEIIEKCNSWPSIDPHNITYLPDLPDTFSSCQSKLVPLKFEEFLNDLNRSHCLPRAKNYSVPSPSSSTEESIFKNIMKRLTTLESNANLTVVYIEEQSNLLAESFDQLEKTQALRFDNLVSIFNQTIMENLNVLRVFANQLKDQSIRILEEQKLNNDQFTAQNSVKLSNLEKQVRIQQKIALLITSSLIAAIIYFILHKELVWKKTEKSTDTKTEVVEEKKEITNT